MKKHTSPQTRAVRAALETDEQYGAVIPPLYLTSNFTFAGFGEPRTYDYTRTGNPTRDALAQTLAELEGGVGATITATGMGAITLACQMLNPGDLVIGPNDCYGGTFRLFNWLAKRGLFRVKLVDQTNLDAVAAAVAEKPKMLWVESPTNPLLRIADLAGLRDLADRCSALMAVDNTFLSPALQRPIEFGADLVVHSTTKYLNGHSYIVGGAVPFDSFLTLRGVRTLHARINQHQSNAQAIAEMLRDHDAVSRVYYPGLAEHPGHELARRQQSGFGGMLSFDLAGGEQAAKAFLENVDLFSLAESLGGVESLACHPASMTHATFDADSLAAAGISAGLVRLSVGIESSEDLLADVRQGLDAAVAVS